MFIFWGLLIQQDLAPTVITTSTCLVTGLRSVWLLFAYRYRHLYMAKLHRIWELEEKLRARQHLRVSGAFDHRRYPQYPRKGHHLEIAVYAITSLGSLALGWSRDGFNASFVLPIPIVVA